MKPILYSHGETSFTNNGLGRLADCITCVVTEERNGIYECQFTYPVTGEMYSRIQIGCILGVIHDDAKDIQPFDIYGKDAPLNGVVTFYAHHISYRLGHVILKPFSASSITDAFAAFPNKTYNSCPFTFWTDKSVSATWKVEVPSAVKAVLGGVEGSILDTYGKGEYEWDKFAVKLHLNRGNDNGVSIRYGVNLSDLDQSLDMSENYNSVAPYWMSVDGTLVTLPEGFITASSVQTGEEIIPVPLDLSSKFEDQPTVEQLRTEAQRQLDNSEAWIPNENISVKFIDLAHTQEYKDIAALQHVRLCDKVSVYCGPLGVNVVKMQIIKTVYNVLLEEYDEIELGTAKTSFADTLMARVSDVTGDLPTSTEVKTMLRQAVDDATDQITGAQNSHVRFIYDANGSLQEIVILDTDDITTATKIWRWNSGGLGYSSNGYSGPYSLAMTQNGAIVADFITTGILNANLITAGTMSAERIFGGTLTLGGANNANGVLTIKDASNNIIGTWNNTGLTLNKGSIAGPSITLGGNNNADGTLAVKDASGNTIGTWNKDGISIYKGSITGGTINGALLTLGGANNGSGTLIVKDASNNTIGTWDNSGLTLNKGSIAGPSITLGGSSNTNGTLTVKNASGTTIGTWNKDGINVTSGSITGGTINGASLTLGGNGNVSGALTVNNANGSKVVELNNGGITVYKDNTKQLYVDSSGNATFAGSLNAATGTFKGELSAATGTFAGTMSAACITSGTMSAARISGGTLTLGGNNNGNGQLVVNNASGTKVVELNNGGITVYKGSTKQLYIDSSGNATFAGSLNAATGTFKGELSAATGTFKGELSAATGTFAGTMSAACITSGTMSAARISGGTLTLGGSNNGNGLIIVNNASGNKVVEINNSGITVYKGSTKQFYIDSSGNVTFAGSLSGATGSFAGSLSAATGTFAGTLSADCITTGTLNADRIGGHSIGVAKLSGSITNGNWGIDFTAGTMSIGNISANNINTGTLSVGGGTGRAGAIAIYNASETLIGSINSNGLRLNNNSGVTQFVMDSTTGNATFGGALSAATGTFAGELSAATGTFGGEISIASSTNTTTVNSSGFKQVSNDGSYVWLYRDQLYINGNGSRIQVIDNGYYTEYLGNSIICHKVESPTLASIAYQLDSNGLIIGSGTKSRLVSTSQYSDRLLYCYETPSPMFGDVGEGVICDDGLCYVNIDPIFAQTITTNNYQVFLQCYGKGDCYVRERRGGWFVVAGTPGLAFGWEIKGKQSDFDQLRLDRNDEKFTVPTQTYGEDAAKHIDEIRKEREAA